MADIILPEGWFSKKDPEGNTYYYSTKGHISWLPPPPRPGAPGTIKSFAEERAGLAAAKALRDARLRGKSAHTALGDEDQEKSSESAPKKQKPPEEWVDDLDDYGLPLQLVPARTPDVIQKMGGILEAMAVANSNYKGRHEVTPVAWGGEPHPRLGCGERLRLGYRPPPPWAPKDEVAAAAKAVSKNQMREWVVDAKEDTFSTVSADAFTCLPPQFKGSPLGYFMGGQVVQGVARRRDEGCVV